MVKYNFHIEANCQGHKEVMNDTSSYGDALMCQVWYDYVKGQKCCGLNPWPCQISYFDLEVKVSIVSGSWMHATHPLKVIDPCAKYGMPMSKQKLSYDTNTCQIPYKFDLEVKSQHRIIIMNVLNTPSHGDRLMCQMWYDYVKANRSYKDILKPLRSKVNVVLKSWMLATHPLMVIYKYAKYGKRMSKQKKNYQPDMKMCQKP